MSKPMLVSPPAILAVFAFAAVPLEFSLHARAQQFGGQGVHYRVDGPLQRLEMIVNTSRILTLDRNVPSIMVMNPEIVDAKPLSPNQIQVSARRPGVTQLNVWDDQKMLHTVDIFVLGDARELENVLKTQFPDASLRLNPLPTSIVISGYVPCPDMVAHIVKIAEDFYPKVINSLTVGGIQQVLLHVKVMEVSRTKLRKLGFDWANINVDDFALQNVTGLIAEYSFSPGSNLVKTNYGETMAFGILNDDNTFFGFLEALRQYNLVKVLAEPTLVTVNGRPASFNSGGEFPILVPQSMGTMSVEYREFGTRIDFVPIVLGNGAIRLEVRPQISEVDPSRSVTMNNITVPGLRTRWVDTAVEMKAGQTLALAGLIQTRVESENKGLPWLSDLPWVGAAFRRVEERNNEIELLIMVTPELVEAIDEHEAPRCGPGETTTTPDAVDFYWRGYLEVPKCCGEGEGGQGEPQPALPGAPVRDGAAVGPEAGVERAVEPAASDQTSSRRRLEPRPSYPAKRVAAPVTRSLRDTGTPPAPGGMLQKPQIRNNPLGSAAGQGTGALNGEPNFIGPVGYDVVK